MFLLNEKIEFPSVDLADKDGLLAIGGDLSTERLLEAYRHGIFPWYNDDEPICWWSPDPRFVLFPEKLKISKSMQQVFRKQQFYFTVNEAFPEVISRCKEVNRKNQEGTWITTDVKEAYIRLHELGIAHSAEAWLNGKLVGGLYGIRIGKIFFGESMFSLVSNASKFAFISYIQQLKNQSVSLIDCQIYSEHLESMGAEMIARSDFSKLLMQYL